MKETVTIKSITEDAITFSNESQITYGHWQTCCEQNYADFKALDDIARNAKFTLPLDFELVENAGFRFGNLPNNMHFVPCYSEQNGYYSSDVSIYLDDEVMLTCEAPIIP